MAEQTKKASLAEAVVNSVTQGFVAVVLVKYIVAAFDLLVGFHRPDTVVLWFYIVGIGFHYAVRRLFNWYVNRSRSER